MQSVGCLTMQMFCCLASEMMLLIITKLYVTSVSKKKRYGSENACKLLLHKQSHNISGGPLENI